VKGRKGQVGRQRGVAAVPTARSSAVRISLELPTFVLSVGLAVLLARIVGFWPWGAVLVGAWVASGPLILVRKIEETIMSGRDDLRRPTEQERQRLAASWLAVTKVAGVDPSHHSLWVQKSPRINAFATAGHTVAVTEAAVERLSPAQLEAILAHELGHHLGGHAWASLLRYWYSLPAMYVFQFATFLSLALTTALGSGSITMSVAIVVLVVGFLGYSLPSYLPWAPWLWSSLRSHLASFGLGAPRNTMPTQSPRQIGYGHALAQLLLDATPVTELENPARPTWGKRIGAPTRPTSSGSAASKPQPLRHARATRATHPND
jgi:Peptidase family M48